MGVMVSPTSQSCMKIKRNNASKAQSKPSVNYCYFPRPTEWDTGKVFPKKCFKPSSHCIVRDLCEDINSVSEKNLPSTSKVQEIPDRKWKAFMTCVKSGFGMWGEKRCEMCIEIQTVKTAFIFFGLWVNEELVSPGLRQNIRVGVCIWKTLCATSCVCSHPKPSRQICSWMLSIYLSSKETQA